MTRTLKALRVFMAGINKNMSKPIIPYSIKAKNRFSNVFSEETKHPRGRKIFLSMMDALDHDTAGEDEDYFRRIVESVIQMGYDCNTPKEMMFELLEKAEKKNERLVHVVNEYHLPGSAGYYQCDGWSYDWELNEDFEKNKNRIIINLLQAKIDAIQELHLIKEQKDYKDRDRWMIELEEFLKMTDVYLQIYEYVPQPTLLPNKI